MGQVAATLGRCTSCGGEGPVGQPCPERVCAKHGHHFIPSEYADKHAAAPSSTREPTVGQVIGDYLVVDKLGQGGFGKVLLALQLPILRLRAALKLMEVASKDGQLAEIMVSKFRGEAEALAALSHPNVVRLLKYGSHEGMPYLVMELVPKARTLKAHIADLATRGQRLPFHDSRRILQQVVNGLDAAHELSIVHRDIKPENIMLQRVAGDDLYVRILDFGLAKFVAERADTSIAMGTPAFMAPEQFTRKNIGPWTDFYAVGVMTFELLTGRKPFAGRTQQEILARKLNPDFDPTRGVEDLGLSEPIKDFLRHALARDPANRYGTAMEFRAALNVAFDHIEGDALMVSQPVDVSGLVRDYVDPDDELDAAPAVGSAQAAASVNVPTSVLEPVAANPVAPGVQVAQAPTSVLEPVAPQPAQATVGKDLVTGTVSGTISGTGSNTGRAARADTPNADSSAEVSDLEPGATAAKNRRRLWLVAAAVLVLGGGAAAIIQSSSEHSAGDHLAGDATRAAAAAVPASKHEVPPARSASAKGAKQATALTSAEGARAHADSPPAAPAQALSAAAGPTANAAADPAADAAASDHAIAAKAAQPPAAPTPQPAAHTVQLASEPVGATVFLDGKAAGKTPMPVTWRGEAQPPRVRLEAAGYQPQTVALGTDDAGSMRVVTLQAEHAQPKAVHTKPRASAPTARRKAPRRTKPARRKPRPARKKSPGFID